MTELDLYRFIVGNNIEWHWNNNEGTQDVIIFPSIYELEEFQKLLTEHDFDDNGISCTMKKGYLAIWMKDLCEAHDIKLERVFPKEKEG